MPRSFNDSNQYQYAPNVSSEGQVRLSSDSQSAVAPVPLQPTGERPSVTTTVAQVRSLLSHPHLVAMLFLQIMFINFQSFRKPASNLSLLEGIQQSGLTINLLMEEGTDFIAFLTLPLVRILSFSDFYGC